MDGRTAMMFDEILDQAMALFGAPVAHEDHVEVALAQIVPEDEGQA